jgi:dolichol-phosphate mannosyltransferase
VVIPVYNERANVARLAEEIERGLSALGDEWEAIWVDDGSTDRTVDVLRQLDPPHRLLRFAGNCGQSAALVAGFEAARGEWLATLDGDGQNDPADIPRLLDHAVACGVDLVNGVRTSRRDSLIRRLSSRIANAYRRRMLHDGVSDVGCSTRVVRRDLALGLPFFDGLHRFLPALVAMRGGTMDELPVNHRRRTSGASKYGVHNRLWVGLRDVRGVRWLQDRHRSWQVVEASEGGEHE